MHSVLLQQVFGPTKPNNTVKLITRVVQRSKHLGYEDMSQFFSYVFYPWFDILSKKILWRGKAKKHLHASFLSFFDIAI